jgi:hypothetical protein
VLPAQHELELELAELLLEGVDLGCDLGAVLLLLGQLGQFGGAGGVRFERLPGVEDGPEPLQLRDDLLCSGLVVPEVRIELALLELRAPLGLAGEVKDPPGPAGRG